jgi:hypothetical protein
MPKTKLSEQERLDLMDDIKAGMRMKDAEEKYGVTGGTVSYYQYKLAKNGHKRGPYKKRMAPIVLGSTIGNARSSKEQVTELVDLLWARLPLPEKLAIIKGVSR